MRKGKFSHVLESRVRIKGENRDPRRIAMYAFYASRGLPIPFELADNEAELAKFADFDTESLTAPPDIEDLIDTLEDV